MPLRLPALCSLLRRTRLVIGVLLGSSTLAVVATYPVFSAMWDEPAHLAAGMEWLSRGSYGYEAAHPPLARVASAFVPWLAGLRTTNRVMLYDEGRALLGAGRRYRRTLFLARLGMLPFLWVLVLACAAWGFRVGGPAGATLAAFFAATNPTLLGHAGVVGTDLAPAAMMLVVLLLWMRWRDGPNLAGALALGVSAGLAATTKFSVIPFIGIAIVLGELARVALRREEPSHAGVARGVGVALGVAALMIWAVYRFDVGPLAPGGASMPAPQLVAGLRDFLRHGSGGHPAFLMGEVRSTGWWYYYVVVLAVKTPLPLLAFTVVGTADTIRRARVERDWSALLPIAGIAGVLLPALASHVDLGVRLILPVYPFAAILAARGALVAWRTSGSDVGVRVRRIATVLLLASSAVIPLRAWPDLLAWFNPIAGRHPERVLLDSNLDWGQDLYRLADTVRARGMDSVYVHYFGSSDLTAAGVPHARRLGKNERVTGYVAASETFLAGVWSDTSLLWLTRREPIARIGPSIRLYFIAKRP